MKLFLPILAMTTLVLGCHHAPSKSETPPAVTAAPGNGKEAPVVNEQNPMSGPVPTQEKVLSSYSLLQLDAAANAYKATLDETMGRPTDTPPPAIFGCPIRGTTAKGAILPIRSLIESKIVREQSSYIRTPAIYLRSRDAAHCEKTCSCPVLLDVLAGLDVRVLKRHEQTRHEDLLLELQSKAAKQGPDTSLECAKKQNWICGSDLEKYLNANLSIDK